MEFKTQGNRLYAQGKTQDAIKAYTRGIDLVEEGGEGSSGATPEDRSCVNLLYSNRSMAHLDLCLVDEALQDAECAIDANPEYGKAYARRAAVMVDLWNFKEALQDLDKAEDLDPSLTESLAELRLRATGKKWVPNCYLRKQIEMRKKYKCDYVVMVELEGGEEIVETVSFPRTHQKVFFRDTQSVLRGLILAGDGGSDTEDLLENIGNLVCEKSPVKDIVAFLRSLKSQLQGEFGPRVASLFHTDFLKRTGGAIPLGSRYFLSEGLRQYSLSTQQTTTPVLFPGRPRWLLDEKLQLEMFTQLQKLPISQLFTIPQDHDRGGCISQTDFQAAARAVTAHREKHLQRDGKCHACATALTDPDPQECLCGQQYCSYLCHLDHWDSHQQECHDIMGPKSDAWGEMGRELMASLRVQTYCYWVMVAEGRIPCKDEPNVVDLWKERNITFEEHGEAAFQREYRFYEQHDAEAMKVGDRALRSNPHVDARLLKVAAGDFLGTWQQRMSTPLVTDSCARIVAKHDRSAFVEHLASRDGMSLLNPNEIAKLFVEHLVKHRSGDPLLKCALVYFAERVPGLIRFNNQ